jgi:hypothetical protein
MHPEGRQSGRRVSHLHRSERDIGAVHGRQGASVSQHRSGRIQGLDREPLTLSLFAEAYPRLLGGLQVMEPKALPLCQGLLKLQRWVRHDTGSC